MDLLGGYGSESEEDEAPANPTPETRGVNNCDGAQVSKSGDGAKRVGGGPSGGGLVRRRRKRALVLPAHIEAALAGGAGLESDDDDDSARPLVRASVAAGDLLSVLPQPKSKAKAAAVLAKATASKRVAPASTRLTTAAGAETWAAAVTPAEDIEEPEAEEDGNRGGGGAGASSTAAGRPSISGLLGLVPPKRPTGGGVRTPPPAALITVRPTPGAAKANGASREASAGASHPSPAAPASWEAGAAASDPPAGSAPAADAVEATAAAWKRTHNATFPLPGGPAPAGGYCQDATGATGSVGGAYEAYPPSHHTPEMFAGDGGFGAGYAAADGYGAGGYAAGAYAADGHVPGGYAAAGGYPAASYAALAGAAAGGAAAAGPELPGAGGGRRREREMERQLAAGNLAALAAAAVKEVTQEVPAYNAVAAAPQGPQPQEVKVAASFYNPRAGATEVTEKPTKLQKRKHQINQLATQAAAMELDILDSRGHSRASRAQAHSKYGW